MAPVIIEPYEMPAAFSVTAISLHQHFRGSVIFPFVVLCRCRIFISHPEDGFRIPVDAAAGSKLQRRAVQAHFHQEILAAGVVRVYLLIVLRGCQGEPAFPGPFLQESRHVLHRDSCAHVQHRPRRAHIDGGDEDFLFFPEESPLNRDWGQPASATAAPEVSIMIHVHFDAPSFLNADYLTASSMKSMILTAMPSRPSSLGWQPSGR